MTARDALQQWSMDREIVLSRVVGAPREKVFHAWTKPDHLPRWFGPDGFEVETLEIDIRDGGRWRFVYLGPGGARYDNRINFRQIVPSRMIVMDHGPDQDDDDSTFRVTVTFDAQDDGKTVITLRQLHPTVAQRDATVSFGAVELGYQTLDKLARFAESM